MKSKQIEEFFIKILMFLSLVAVFGFTIGIIFTIFRRGWSCITWEMVTSLPGGDFI